jgi:hypothetical protein
VEVKLYSFFNLGVGGGGGAWPASSPGRFTPGKETQYSFYRRLVGTQGRSGRVWKMWPPQGFDPRTVQPVASWIGLVLAITVIPRLTKIIRSGITFVSRNVISRRFLQKIV